MVATKRKDMSPTAVALSALLFAAGYFACMEMGNALAQRPGIATAFWPTVGYCTAMFLVFEPRLIPFLMGAAFCAHLGFDLLHGFHPWTGLLLCANCLLAACLSILLVRRLLGGKPRLDNLRQLLIFLGAAGLLLPVLSATAGTAIAALHAAGAPSLRTWWSRWFSDMLGVFILAPFLLAWVPRAYRPRSGLGPAPWIESAAAVAGLAAVTAAVFGVPGPRAMSLEFLVIPFLLWSALRLPLRTTTAMNLVLALIVTFCTVRGLGPFAGGQNPDTLRSLILQGFVALQGATAVILTAVLEERRGAMERLRGNESELARAQQIAGMGSWSADLDTGIVHWSRNMHAINGTDPDQPPPRIGDMGRFLSPEDRTAFAKAVGETAPGSGSPSLEVRIQHPDGDVRTMLIRWERRTDPDGRVVRLIGTEQDITDRRNVEESQRAQQRQMIQADKMASLGVLASGVAHEINNPIHTIKLNMQLIGDVWASLQPLLDSYREENGDFLTGGLPYTQARVEMPAILSGIAEAAGHIESIAGDLKSYARMDAAPLMMEINLNLAVKAAATLAGAFIAKATTRFRLELAESLPPIRGNIHRLEQVVINLLQNACEALAAPQQGILVRTAADADGRMVTLTVMDEGRGMDAEVLARIKEPFFTTKRSCGGTGLGLSVSDTIVEEHGGTLTFESAPGRGATATVRFPAAREPAEGGTP